MKLTGLYLFLVLSSTARAQMVQSLSCGSNKEVESTTKEDSNSVKSARVTKVVPQEYLNLVHNLFSDHGIVAEHLQDIYRSKSSAKVFLTNFGRKKIGYIFDDQGHNHPTNEKDLLTQEEFSELEDLFNELEVPTHKIDELSSYRVGYLWYQSHMCIPSYWQLSFDAE